MLIIFIIMSYMVWGTSLGEVINVQSSNIVVNEFEPQSRYYIYFRLGKVWLWK